METTVAYLLAEIVAAFPARRAARFDLMANSVQREEPLLTAEAFFDKEDWTRLDPKWLDEAPEGWATALSFLSDEAVCFYIPAFISADLRGELQRAEPTFHLTHGFDNFSRDRRIRPRASATWTEYVTQRWSHLTLEQARAIVHFLEWQVLKDGMAIAHGASEALSAFWYDRVTARRNGR